MKKILICCLLAALATALPKMGKTQDTSTVDKLLTYIIAPLDKSQIPTAFLAEKRTIFLGMNTFNGTLTDDNVFVTNLWRMMYVQLQQSYVGNASNPLPEITTVNNALENHTQPNQPTPVPLLIGQYNSIDDNAVNNGLLTYILPNFSIAIKKGFKQKRTWYEHSPPITPNTNRHYIFVQ